MPPPWTILNTLKWLTGYLGGKNVPEARLNAEHLIAHALGIGRLDIYLQFERVLTAEELAHLKPLIERRAAREPLQYIIGTQPFRNVNIKVKKGVLIPRPETEIVVEEILEHIPKDSCIDLLELGVGSGAILAAIASERENITITGTEISLDALEVARENLGAFQSRLSLLQGDLFEPVKGLKFDMIVSNPPYIASGAWADLQPEVRDFEPKEALTAGEDGLDFYRNILNDAPSYLKEGGRLILELGDGQAGAVVELANKVARFNNIKIRKDLNGKERVFSAQVS